MKRFLILVVLSLFLAGCTCRCEDPKDEEQREYGKS